MTKKIEIHFVGPEAAAKVREIALAAYEEYRETLIPPPGIIYETVEDTAASIAEGGAVLALLGVAPVGTTRFKPADDHLYIGRVAVRPEYRRQGIATAMMDAIEKHGRSLGFLQSQVEVRLSLPENIAVYAANGYVEISRQPHPRVPTATTVRMAKQLT